MTWRSETKKPCLPYFEIMIFPGFPQDFLHGQKPSTDKIAKIKH